MKKKTMKISGGELVGYIISGLIALGGFTLAALGIIGRNLSSIDNPLRQANDKFADAITLGFQPLGAIILLVGVIIAVIILLVVGKRVDVEDERQARRQQRFSLEQEGEGESNA